MSLWSAVQDKGPVAATSQVASVAEVRVLAEAAAEHPLTLEEYVRQYFKDTPILADIARCESRFRQFDTKGNVIRGEVNDQDVGVMQINEYYHAATSKKLGMDINTLDGNLAYGKYLYEKQGSQPWISSSPCWKKFEVAVALKKK